MISSDFLWVEKYRPRMINDVILPEAIKKTFMSYVSSGNIPHLLLCGKAGTGKTTTAKAIVEQIGCNYIVVNGSKDGNIDTMRTTIYDFATTISMTGGKKYIIIDEADGMTPTAQNALKTFIEENSKSCGFIFTCNTKNKIIPPIHSRCAVVDFVIPKNEVLELAKQFMERTKFILKQENVEFDKAILADFIKKYIPDWRRCLNEMQKCSISGVLEHDYLKNSITDIDTLIGFIKDKKFTSIRQWAAENSSTDSSVIFGALYDNLSNKLTPKGVASLVLIIAKYQYQAAFVENQEINNMACFAEIMADIDVVFK